MAIRQAIAIDSVGSGGFRVAGVWRPGSLLVVADAAHDWRPQRLADINLDDLAPVLGAPTGEVEFLLLGVGAVQAQPPALLRQALQRAGVGLEFMATEAAARTHNVLASQGRRFATGLIAL